MLKILLTGCNGQVGSLAAEQLKLRSELLAVDREQLDIADKDAVFKLVTEFRPDVIINAAAYTAVDRAEEEVELAFQVNRDGPAFLAQAAESIGAAILHISTDYVFAGDKLTSYEETDTPEPKGVYGQSKLAGELAVIESCSRHIILRTAWVFGENGNNFVKTMIRLGRTRDQIGVVGDQFGGPTYAGDIASALINIADKYYSGDDILWGIYHYSGLPSLSWYDFACYIFKQAAQQGMITNVPEVKNITTEEYPTLTQRPANSRLDMDKIEQNFSIKPSDWKKALDNIKPYGEM